MFRKCWASPLAAGVGWVSFLILGCTRDHSERFTPNSDAARQALIKVLDEWRAGQPPGEISGTPAIRAADSQRRAGQKLLKYEVLGELPADSGRRFQVKLSLDQPPGEEKVQYVVLGIDPLWVFRQEDYDMMTHWDHPMPNPGAATTGSPTPSGGAKGK